MRLNERLAREGEFLFRWRSYLPLLVLLLAIPVLRISAELDASLDETLEDLWTYGCMMVSVFGLVLRCMTVGFVPAGTSGRNTRGQVAQTLNTTGMYSVTRNPLYFSNLLIVFGVVAAIKVWWFVLLIGLVFWLFIERVIAAEETFLSKKFGERYEDWARQTPLFLPQWRQWQRPALTFSLRAVLAREPSTLAVTATTYCLFEAAIDIGFENQPIRQWLQEDALWAWAFLLSAALFVIARALKKHTRFLYVEKR